MKVVLALSVFGLLVTSFPLIRGARHTVGLAGVAVLLFLSGFGIKRQLTSTPLLWANIAVNAIVSIAIWNRLDDLDR